METDPDNEIVKLCAEGMHLEGEGKREEAKAQFEKAWNSAKTVKEKFIAAHYVARHQKDVSNKLKWDEKALDLALKINEEGIESGYPSLYLNIGKCYEDLNNPGKARENYELALSFTGYLSGDGYGKMIKSGIENGIRRVAGKDSQIK